MKRAEAPKRWLDDVGGGLSNERDVLRSGLNLDPPAGQKDAVWAAILGGLPPGGGGAAGGGAGKALASKGVSGAAKAASAAAKASAVAKAGAATSATSTTVATLAAGGLVKSALVGAGSAALLVGAYTAVTPPSDPPAPPASHVEMATGTRPPLELSSRGMRAVLGHAPPPVAQPENEAPWSPPVPEEAASARPDARPATRAAMAAPASEPVPRATLMIEASDALTNVRATLRAGNTAGALAQLETMRVRFPADLLGEEREVLTIEALYYAGSRDQARTRAQAFIRLAPNSLHAVRLQSFAR